MAFVNTVQNISALRAFSGMSNDDEAEVSGFYSEADGGGGLFVFLSGSTATDDNGSVIQPNSGTGRWLRVLAGQGGGYATPGGPAGPVSVKWWGAKGNGNSGDDTINTTALNNAIAYAYALGSTYNSVPCSVLIPSGTYYINNAINVKGDESSTVNIFGEGINNSVVKAVSSGFSGSSMFLSAPQPVGSNYTCQRWAFKKMTLDGGGSSNNLICHDLYSNTYYATGGSTSRGVVEEVVFQNGGYGLKVYGWVNTIRDCQALGCGVGYYLQSANGCVLERCYANSCGGYATGPTGAPIQIETALGLFINATWENNYGPVLLDGVNGCTLHNCYAESNGSTSSGKVAQNTQLVAGGGTLCQDIIIIGGYFSGGTPPAQSGPPPFNLYVFEFANVDGYSMINPFVEVGRQLVLRVNGPSSSGFGPNAGVVSFSSLSVDWLNAPDAKIVDQIINYFPNPNFDEGKDNLACWNLTVSPAGASASLYNYNTTGYSALNVRYGQNSILFQGPSTAAYAYVDFSLASYLCNILAGKNVRAVALLKLSSSYASSGKVPVLSLGSANSGWTSFGFGGDWVFLITAPITLASSLSSLDLQLSGCTSAQNNMGSSDYIYVDSIWIIPGNVSSQSLLCGNISTLDCAKWAVYRQYTVATPPAPPTFAPNYVGEEVLNTNASPPAWYKAADLTSANWKAL